MIDTAVNQAVSRIIRGLNDTGLINFKFTFPTQTQQFRYPIPQGNVAQGSVVFSGIARAGVNLSITVGGQSVTYTTQAGDTNLAIIVAKFLSILNASTITSSIVGLVSPQVNTVNTIVFSARASGTAGNAITLAATSSDVLPNPLTITPSAATLSGGTATSPLIMQVRRVLYQPYGMPYVREKVPGARLVSWSKFQQMNGAGYLEAFSFSQEPDVCAVTPTRDALHFFPAPVSAGDLVTLHYSPQLTLGTGEPFLTAQSDVVPLPDEMRDLVLTGAMIRMWPIAGEHGMAQNAMAMFKAELEETRQQWEMASSGETLQITDVRDVLAQTGWYP
jgi:hypothetical protein